MKRYIDFINEKSSYKLTIKDSQELSDFLNHVLQNMDNEPNLLRSAYARIQKTLHEIKQGNYTKSALSFLFNDIYYFIEGGRNMHDLRMWSEKLMELDIENYDTLLSIINNYNHILNKLKSKKIECGDGFNIKSWAFEKEGLEPIEESKDEYYGEILYEAKVSDTKRVKGGVEYRGEVFPGFNKPKRSKSGEKSKFRVLAKEGDEIKVINFGYRGMEDYTQHKDPKRKKSFRARHKCDPVSKLSKLTARYWSCQYLWSGKDKPVTESYEDYCDFGGNYISTYLENNPDIDEDEFSEYVTVNNKADRDMGELQDISKEEIERLGKEFKNNLEPIKEKFKASLFGLNDIPEVFMIMGFDKESAQILKKFAVRAFKNKGDKGLMDFFKETTGHDIFNISKGKYSFEPVTSDVYENRKEEKEKELKKAEKRYLSKKEIERLTDDQRKYLVNKRKEEGSYNDDDINK